MKNNVFTIYGSSDDLIEITGGPGANEFCVNSSGENIIVAAFSLGGKIKIYALYDTCWCFAVGKMDEYIPIPEDWKIETYPSKENDYSMELKITVPKDVGIVKIDHK